MKKRITIQFILSAIISLTAASICLSSELSESESELIHKIAASYRANQEVLDSFDCNYSLEIKYSPDGQVQGGIVLPVLVSKTGRYAFNDDKVYIKETNIELDTTFCFVKNGTLLKERIDEPEAPGLIMTGTDGIADIPPPTPDPWNFVDEGISIELDKLDKDENMTISSVKYITWQNQKYIEVAINMSFGIPGGTSMSMPWKIWYSEDEGLVPVKISFTRGDEYEHTSDINFKSFNVNGATVYIPLQMHIKKTNKGKLAEEWIYKIDEKSIRLNPNLPDELFQLEILPNDQIINQDLKIQTRVPAEGIIGVPAPDFTLELLGGADEKVTLSKVKADVIVLDFWATWCGPCRIMHPVLEAVHKWVEENKKSVAFYCINEKEDPDLVAEYWKKNGYDMPVLFDSDSSVFSSYKGSGIPYIIIISEGIIRNVHIGSGAEVDVLEKYIKDMIIDALEN